MRIVLLQPTLRPDGPERFVRELGVALAACGHDVTLLTHRHPSSTEHDSGVRVIELRRPPERPPLTWYEDHVANVPGVTWHLWRGAYDVAHAFSPAVGWAALGARRLGGPPVAFSFQGTPERTELVRRRYRLEMVEALARGADLVGVDSEAAANRFRAYFARDPVVLPGATDDDRERLAARYDAAYASLDAGPRG